jgi:hypothetical protein
MTVRLGRRRLFGMLGGGVAALALAACGQPQGGPHAAGTHPPGAKPFGLAGGPDVPADLPAGTDYSVYFARFAPADEPNGDLAKVVWPDYVLRAGPEVKRLYEFQVVNGELMRYFPCFCGCFLEDGHRSNRDCYVEEVRPDGSVVFDPMAPT